MNDSEPDQQTNLLADQGFEFTDQPDTIDLDDDPEFQPHPRRRVHWFTLLLIGLVIWGAGFLTGVLVDRAFAGVLG